MSYDMGIHEHLTFEEMQKVITIGGSEISEQELNFLLQITEKEIFCPVCAKRAEAFEALRSIVRADKIDATERIIYLIVTDSWLGIGIASRDDLEMMSELASISDGHYQLDRIIDILEPILKEYLFDIGRDATKVKLEHCCLCAMPEEAVWYPSRFGSYVQFETSST